MKSKMKMFLKSLWAFITDHKYGSSIFGALILYFGTAIGWAVTHYIDLSEKKGAIIGYIKDAPGTLIVKLDNDGPVLDSSGGWARVRFDSVEPGEHQLEYGYDGYHTSFHLIWVIGGRDNPIDLPALVSVFEPKPPLSRIPLKSVQYNYRSKNGEDPLIPTKYWEVTNKTFPNLANVETGPTDDNYWVFLGNWDENNWVDRRFILDSPDPKIGDYITAKRLALARSDAPERLIFSSAYRLGTLEAVITPGQEVEIYSVLDVGDGNYWAQVGALSPAVSTIQEERMQ